MAPADQAPAEFAELAMIANAASYDLIVIGGGAAGLTAAAVGAASGLSVLLLEYSSLIGGTTAISGGMIWIPANHKMAQGNFADSTAEANAYLDATLPRTADRSLRDAFLARGDEMIRFLEARTAVRLRCVRTYPDYYSELPGAKAGARVLEPVPFDGRELGRSFALLRPPLPEFMLFGGMMVSREDVAHFRKVARSPRSFARVVRLVIGYSIQRLQAPRGSTLYLGNALAARLYKSARDLGVEIRLGITVERLIQDGGRVSGVEISVKGERGEVQARRGVVLATGGISHDAELRRRYVPAQAGHLSATVDSGANKGGARLALEAGARLREPSETGAFWVPCSCFSRPDGARALYPHTVTDRAKPGLVAVDSTGKRFVNEALSYHEFGLAQLRASATAIPAYLICDRHFMWKYGLGRVKPFALSISADIRSGYLKRGATLDELARALRIPEQNLVGTVAAFNADAVDGMDRQFGRGTTIYQRHLGDAERTPNPCVAPLDTGPFYAVAVYPADLGMSAGLITDAHARVLDQRGTPIPGLYACGNDMDSLMAGAYPGPGITLGPALTFGYIAARDAAGES
jgi:succinate dehydrogenase/fumarate reductase flavoprotein subunit